MRPAPSALTAVICIGALLTACSGSRGSDEAAPPVATSGPPVTYAALGGDETDGSGLADPLRQAWPQVLYRTALPRQTVHVNLASPGSTVATALSEQVPIALEVAPTLATVWLTSADVEGRTPLADYERDLAQLLEILGDGSETDVLVANGLPAGPEAEPYRAAVERAAAGTGATVVDLEGIDLGSGSPAHVEVAEAFAAALDRQAGGDD